MTSRLALGSVAGLLLALCCGCRGEFSLDDLGETDGDGDGDPTGDGDGDPVNLLGPPSFEAWTADQISIRRRFRSLASGPDDALRAASDCTSDS